MPRNLKPDAVKTGSGKRVPEKGVTVVLGGSGMTGPGPNVGSAEWMYLAGQKDLPSWLTHRLNAMGVSQVALDTHLNQRRNAHPAGATSASGVADGFDVANVQDALYVLHGALPKNPPMLGQWHGYTNLSGIPDWGTLKVADQSLVDRGLLPVVAPGAAVGSGEATADQVYPYFFKAASPLVGSPFTQIGGDPQTDPEFNSGLSIYGTGKGLGNTGGFTRPGDDVDQDVKLTAHILPRYTTTDDVTGLPLRREVIISGTLYPADKGVLALIHWPQGINGAVPSVNHFLAQPLADRCVAALLLGQGIVGEGCALSECSEGACDGEPGGIFAMGRDPVSGAYNPYAFPGQASGQYDLDELFNGVNRLDSSDLKAPFPTTGTPQNREFLGTTPAPGQVRLGTDPQSGMADPTGYGIPVLGGNLNAYDLTQPPSDLANVAAPRTGHYVVGNSIVRMEQATGPGTYYSGVNFFRYRLPVLKDYTLSGLKWTPQGEAATTTREKFRYVERATPAVGSGVLTYAGNWENPFTEDQISWQMARYRHAFLLPSVEGVGDSQEVGSYWLIHFKNERNFESFVRDGVMPWDATNGYDVYGSQTFATVNHTEDTGNVVNEQSSSTDFHAPFGYAPNYGYVSPSYFTRRNVVFEQTTPGNLTFTATHSWITNATTHGVVWTSGVASFTPVQISGANSGDPNLEIIDIQIDETSTEFWTRAFRTDESQLDGQNVSPISATLDPALLSSMCPAFITFFPFAYGPHPSPPVDQPGGPSGEFSLHADTANGLSDVNTPDLPSRVEIPFTHMGPGGANQYSLTNGPRTTDQVDIGLANGAPIVFVGDAESPSFSENGKMRAFFRRPSLHFTAAAAVEPYSANAGHGIIVAPTGGDIIMMHTTSFNDAAGAGTTSGTFGNFVITGPTPRNSYAVLFNSSKDVWERFLDETYRYSSTWQVDSAATAGLHTSVYGASARGYLIGPGMSSWANGPIEVPVRAGLQNAFSPVWASEAWLPMNLHTTSFASHGSALLFVDMVGDGSVKGELQVKGWPDRNPPMTDRGNAPYPSTGLLVYPKTDYSAPPIRPSLGDDGITQPDYSGLNQGTREFVRAFDAGFGGAVDAAGQPFVTVRLDGIRLPEIAFNAPGPGSLNRADASFNTYLAVMLKVPGLTTWMDVGRVDGSGPSKQDATQDGAGCQVVGVDTFSDIDPDTGIVYCQIRCNVGPAVNLFASTGIEGSVVGEVPVLIKVVMLSTASLLDMEHLFDGTRIVGAVPGPGVQNAQVRGLCGIRIVEPV